jgi:hypothetical protein
MLAFSTSAAGHQETNSEATETVGLAPLCCPPRSRIARRQDTSKFTAVRGAFPASLTPALT